MGDDPIATWKSKIKWYSDNTHFKDLNRIDGMPTEFEWNIFPGITTLGLLEKIQRLMTDWQCEPENLKGRIIFLSIYNDIEWKATGTKNNVNTIHRQLRILLANSLAVIGLSWGLRNVPWQNRRILRSNGRRNDVEFLWIQSSNISCLGRRELRSKERDKKSIHFNSSDENIEMILRILRIRSLSTEQQQICVTKYPKILGLLRNLQHLIIWKRWKFLPTSLLQKILPLHSSGET